MDRFSDGGALGDIRSGKLMDFFRIDTTFGDMVNLDRSAAFSSLCDDLKYRTFNPTLIIATMVTIILPIKIE